MSLEDLLQGLVAGDDDEQDEMAGLGALGGILGGVLGGGALPQQSQGGAIGLDDLISGLGGMQQPVPQPQPQPARRGGLLGILGSIFGMGGSRATQSPIGGGGILGGGQSNPMQQGIANAISEKLGIPPEIAIVVVSFAMAKLLQSVQQRAVQRRDGIQAPQGQGGIDLGDLLKGLGGRQRLDAEKLMPSGMPQELAEQTGLDIDTAEQGLEEVFEMLGRGGKAAQSGGGWSADVVR